MKPVFRLSHYSALILAAGLAACTTYKAMPLPIASDLKNSTAELQRPDGFDPAKKLSLADIDGLVLLNNPDLISARDGHGLAQAQLLQASVPPNPSFTGSKASLLSGPADAAALTAGISQDIKSLITLWAQRKSADYSAQQVDADLLWQEWQTLTKARLLVVDIVENDKLRVDVGVAAKLLDDRVSHGRSAQEAGDLDLTSTAPDLAAMGDLKRQLEDLDRQQLSRRHDLNAMLGLSADTSLALDTALILPQIDAAAIRSNLPNLPQHRPDLVALQLGYQAEDQNLWAAILGQFPALTFGGTWSRDTSRVYSAGPDITFDLPIFNRNQGPIAVETATRQQLYDQYAARISATAGEVEAMLTERALAEKQLVDLERESATTADTFQRANAAFDERLIDERSFVDLATLKSAKQQQRIALEQSLFEGQVAIAALIGEGLPTIALLTNPTQPSR